MLKHIHTFAMYVCMYACALVNMCILNLLNVYIRIYIYIYIYIYVQRIEQKLQTIESTRRIPLRWTINSQEYEETKAISNSKEKHKLRKRMISAARERWFLLKLKSKYAG